MERRHFLNICAVAGMSAAAIPLKSQAGQSGSEVQMAEGKKPVIGGIIPADQVRFYNMGPWSSPHHC